MNYKGTYFDFELKHQLHKAFDALCSFIESKSDKVFILKEMQEKGKQL